MINNCLIINALLSTGGYVIAVRLIPGFRQKFIDKNRVGKDLCKKNKKEIPESMGVLIGLVFLVVLFLFIPVPFTLGEATKTGSKTATFPHEKFVELLVALLSIAVMMLLGFIDDIFDLRWRYKLVLPSIAMIPLLMVYAVYYNLTTIIMPKFLRTFVGYSLDIGALYYIYMGMLAVFCTNAINILAGINGLEVGQSLIISTSILLFNFIELSLGHQVDAHKFSIYLMLPFLAVSLALWKFNKIFMLL
uniref:UDP-N-acetylglucosamine--dolichyl-phosphate N-acetylglucosaminephosphotransferase n=1 Tax=Glossina morsitans morsitans TaxID=37546 RepID=A0A1B0FP39_GLOMM